MATTVYEREIGFSGIYPPRPNRGVPSGFRLRHNLIVD